MTIEFAFYACEQESPEAMAIAKDVLRQQTMIGVWLAYKKSLASYLTTPLTTDRMGCALLHAAPKSRKLWCASRVDSDDCHRDSDSALQGAMNETGGESWP